MNLTRSANHRGRWGGLLIASLFAVVASGCGGDRIYPVEGKVVWKDGQPATELEGALVVFDLPEKQTNANGSVKADGTFRLTTKKDGDGALAGEYKVLIVERRKAGGGIDPSEMAPGYMNVKYSSPESSDLRATVQAGPNNITLTVERQPKKR